MESFDITTLDVEPHRPRVLHSASEARAIAIALPGGEEMQEHQTHEAAFLHVVQGEIEIEQDGREAARGGPGLFACFEANERRRIRAVSDTRLVLILGPWPGVGHPSREA